jgi:predicted ATPase
LASADRPAVLVLDDLDHADDSSLTLLPQVLRALGRSTVLVCCAYEPDGQHPKEWIEVRGALDAAAATEDLSLSGLPSEDVRRLLVTGGLRVPAQDVIDRVLTVTAGNPLFVVELARHLASGGSNDSGRPLPLTRPPATRSGRIGRVIVLRLVLLAR